MKFQSIFLQMTFCTVTNEFQKLLSHALLSIFLGAGMVACPLSTPTLVSGAGDNAVSAVSEPEQFPAAEDLNFLLFSLPMQTL